MTVPYDLNTLVFDEFSYLLQLCLTGFMFMMQSPVLYMTCYRVVSERDTRIRETMRIMGLSDLAYWASWLLYYTIVQVIIATVCLVIITYGGVLVHSSKTIIWLIFYAYGLKNFAWIVFVQAFFTNPKNAAIFASLMPAFGGLINSGVSSDLFPKFAVRLASLVPTVTLIRIIKTLTYYE